nr:NADH:flavin oxidoreductase/NADH oxidase [Acuticoccus kalidii]
MALRGVTLKNRIVVAPMCQYSAVDGHATEWHLAHHGRFALGGVGLTILEATGVTAAGRITPGCLGIYDDGHVEGLSRIVDLYHAHGSAAGIQLGHAGRKASTRRPWDGAGPLDPDGREPPWPTLAPSALPAVEGWHTPKALTKAEIAEIVDAFALAAKRADRAGFDVIEIHGAHGYLAHTFMSPLSNTRTDEYGGSLANRMRFPLEVVEAIAAVWPQDKPLFYRASVTDNAEGGLTVEDTVALARELKARRVDVIDCSSGGIAGSVSLQMVLPKPGFQVPLAEAVREGAGIATMAVGMITEPELAEEILQSDKADLIAIAREFLSDGAWPYRAAEALGHPDPFAVLPQQYAFYLRRRAQSAKS